MQTLVRLIRWFKPYPSEQFLKSMPPGEWNAPIESLRRGIAPYFEVWEGYLLWVTMDGALSHLMRACWG